MSPPSARQASAKAASATGRRRRIASTAVSAASATAHSSQGEPTVSSRLVFQKCRVGRGTGTKAWAKTRSTAPIAGSRQCHAGMKLESAGARRSITEISAPTATISPARASRRLSLDSPAARRQRTTPVGTAIARASSAA